MWNKCQTWNRLSVGSRSVRVGKYRRKLNLCIVVAAEVVVVAVAAVVEFHVDTIQTDDACWSRKCFGGASGSMICERKCSCSHGRRRPWKCQWVAGLVGICWQEMDSWMKMEVKV